MAKQPTVISHWYQLIESFQTSSLSFYKAVEAALDERMIPEMKGTRIEFKEGGLLSAHREYLHIARGRYSFDICAAPFGTGYFFSWWLTEPQSPFGILYFMICVVFSSFIGGVFFRYGMITNGLFGGAIMMILGTSGVLGLCMFFVRERILDIEDVLLTTPLFGRLYERLFSPPTFYKIDTALMFQQTVHNAVLEVIDAMTAAKGLRGLSEIERKPILKTFARSA
jgi:hypothetical protein